MFGSYGKLDGKKRSEKIDINVAPLYINLVDFILHSICPEKMNPLISYTSSIILLSPTFFSLLFFLHPNNTRKNRRDSILPSLLFSDFKRTITIQISKI